MDLTLLFMIFAFIGGAVAWHFFHAKAKADIAALYARVTSLEGKSPAPAVAPTPPPA